MKDVLIKIILFFVFTFIVMCEISKAQPFSTTEEEEKIKLSGLYYWEEVKSESIDEAKQLAKEALIVAVINNYNSDINVSNIKSINIEGIDYLVFKRGSKFRATAFVGKAHITKQIKTLKELGSFEVTHTEKQKQNIKVTVRNITGSTSDSMKCLNNKPNEIDNKKENVEFSLVKGNEERILEKMDISKNDLIEDKVDRVDCNKIITEMLTSFNNINELFVLLNKFKNEGKLVYGNKDSFQPNADCDILIIDPSGNSLKGYLIKKENDYYDLLSNTIVPDIQKTYKDMVAIWIMYFTK